MGWAEEAVAGLVATGQDLVGWPFGLAVAASAAGEEPAVAATDDEHRGGVFEIGSITKTMTATLAALAELDGRLSLDDPIGRWLDAGDNADLTVRELATHTSGLPRLAPNSDAGEGFDPEDPYAAYTAALAEEGLRATTLDGRGHGLYSNFGFQLLGLVVERATGRTYADLLLGEIAEPLGLSSLAVDNDTSRLGGHDRGRPRRPWTTQLPGPGTVLASAADTLGWGVATLQPPTDRFAAAVGRVRSEGLAWQVRPTGVLWHNGGTYGFHSMLALDPASGRVLVALAADGDASDLDAAVLQVLAGVDPATLRPVEVTDADRQRCAVHVERFLAGDWPALIDAAGDGLADALRRHDGMWQGLVDAHGPPAGWHLVRKRGGEPFQARALVTFGTTDLALDLTLAGDLLQGLLVGPA